LKKTPEFDLAPKNLILKSLLRDFIEFAGYFTGMPLPKNTIATGVALIFHVKHGSTKRLEFLDWELKNWPEIYSKELDKCLYLPSILENYSGKLLIPFVLLYEGATISYDINRILFSIEEQTFTVPLEIEDRTYKFYKELRLNLQKNFKFYNALNVRLKSCRLERGYINMKIQPVDYESYVHTNLVLDATECNDSLRMYLHRDGKLEPLESSPLANNLGINFLLFTSSGYLLVVKRSEEVAFRRGEFAPSVSGTVSYSDFCGKQVVRGSKGLFMRELEEELGITVNDIDKLEFLGIARDLIRGGEPELFLLVKTRLTRKQIQEKLKVAKDNFEIEGIDFFDFKQYGCLKAEERGNICREKYSEFLELLKKFLYTYKDALSINLLASISLWERSFCRQEKKKD